MQENTHAELWQYEKIMMAGKKLQGKRNGWREEGGSAYRNELAWL